MTQVQVQAYAASYAQSRLWFLHQLEPELTAYHMPMVWRLRGMLDVRALEQALASLVERHPTLRSSFRLQGSEVQQLIHPPGAFALAAEELAGRNGEEVIGEWLEEEGRTPFDLLSGVLLRARLLQATPDEHVLLVNHHHIASDGWSQFVMARDLTELYNAHRTGRPSGLAPLKVHYQDYAVWQRQRLSGARLQTLKDYWINQLTGLESLELPTDHPRPPTSSHKGASVFFEIPPELLAPFEQLCRLEGATLQMGLLALLALLLHRYSRQNEFAIGVPIWGRNHPDLEPLIGFFINTLPVRTRFTSQQSFRDLLCHVKASSLATYDHQDLPFEQIVEALNLPRDTSRNPLVQVMLQLIELPDASLHELQNLEAELLKPRAYSSLFDLEFFLRRVPHGLNAQIVFAADLFNSDRIERLTGHLLTLLGSVVKGPDAALETLDLLPEPERQLIESWQQGPVVEVPPLCVHQLFEQQVERTPEAIALVFGDQQITYSELNARSNQLAHRLIARGVGPNRVVALDAQRSIELTVAMLAILKAGGAYLPLDPAWPPQRRDQVLAEARPWLRIALDGLAGDCQDPIPCANTASNPAPRATLDALAYVIFTSGSTGVPKGVAMPQRAFANLIRWHQQDERLARPARTLQFAAPGFDVSLQEIFSTLCCGGSLLIVADADRQDPQRLWRVIQAGTIERLFLPYVVLEQLAIAAQVASTPAAPSHLRDVVSAGEALKLTDAISRFLADRPACRLHNHYGPTETHVVCSHLLAFDPAGWPLAAPIGRPIAATNLQVVDRAGKPCPIGIAGELLIGGDGLASGYLNRPDLTAERFRFAPLLDGLSDFAATDRRAASTATATGACFYRSGDLVAWNPDGTLVYVGRLDQQIKLRGFRIEPGDIESHLLAHPAVAQAVVVLRQDHPNHPRLIAYWVRQKTIPTPTTSASTNRPTPTTPSKRDTEKLRSFFVERLPDPMVPSAFIELDALPLTSNGKLDRRALPAPSLSVAAEQRVKPSTNLELKLHALWAEVLGHGDFGIDDNFFQVGGHSLTAARLIAAIDDQLSIRLPIATIFHAPQIGLLAERLAQSAVFPEAIDPCFVPLEREGTSAPLFVIHGYAGDVFCYTDFALALSPTRPVYGLQARGIDGHAERHRDLQEMAEHYADLIDQHYPDGVVHLLGQSAGGWYAWAVASVLVRRGRLIGMMAILDSGPTAAISARLRASLLARRTARRLPTYLHLLRHNKRPRNLLAFLQERQRNLTAHLQRFRVPPAPLLQEEATAPGDRCEPPIDYFVGLCQRYRPQPQPLRVHLLTSRHDPRLTYHLWRAMACGGVVARQLFEEHHHFHTAAHADQLAAAIAEILEQVEAV